jgi:hypothetical protein
MVAPGFTVDQIGAVLLRRRVAVFGTAPQPPE